MALTFVGGLTLEARRKNIVLPVEDASLPAVVRLKLIDGCLPTVAAGDTVAEGERVAENDDGFRILSPVCGEVTAADDGFVTVRSTRGGEPVGCRRSSRRWSRSATRTCPNVSSRRAWSAP